MKEITDLIIEIDYEQIATYNFPKNKKFGLITIINNVKYEFLITLKDNSEKLLIIGSGALSPTSKHDRSRPYFNRHSWKFNESTICYNDPTLYIDDDLLGPWGVGTIDDWYLEKIAMIIKEIAKNIHIKNENLLFYGSSSGGFCSLLLSTLIKDSYSLAEIPQFNLKTNWRKHYLLLIKHCFNGLPEKEILERWSYRLKVIDLIKKEKYIPNAFLLLDYSYEADVEMQYAPFFQDLKEINGDITDKIHIIIQWKNKGHKAQSYKQTVKALDRVMEHMDSDNEKTIQKIRNLVSLVNLKIFLNKTLLLDILFNFLILWILLIAIIMNSFKFNYFHKITVIMKYNNLIIKSIKNEKQINR